jgi:hypothetical protein
VNDGIHAAYRMLRNDIYQLISVVGVCVCGRIPEGVGEIWLSFYLWEYVEFCLEKGEQKEMLLLTDLLFS